MNFIKGQNMFEHKDGGFHARYNPIDGNFYRVGNTKRRKDGDRVGWIRNGYIILNVDGKDTRAHRLAWFLYYGDWPTLDIDHINGDRSDNRICNLRQVTRQVNLQNLKRCHRDNKTGFLGIVEVGGRFYARIRVNGKGIPLGGYKTPQEAHNAYISAKKIMHEGFC
jgi:hypothetical protein